MVVIDDDAVSRLMLTRALDQAGMPHVTFDSGEAGLAYIDAHEVSLVLLDLVMPDPDGYAVLAKLRGSDRTLELPVVVLTGVEAEEEVSRAFAMGADDFVRKPFRAAELTARIRSQLNLRASVDELARRERDARVVLELTQALASTLDFRNILYTVVRRIADVAHVDRCSIVLVQDDGKVGYVVAASDDRDLRDLPIDLHKYPEIQRVISTGEPLIIDDARTHPLFDIVRGEVERASFRSLACLPILYDDKPLGVLFLRSREAKSANSHELWVARTVGSATAIALRNARIMQSLKDQTRESTYARFEAERRLRALEPYADFFHSAAEGIVVFESNGQIVFSNARASDIVERTSQDLAKIAFEAIVIAPQRDAFRAAAKLAKGELRDIPAPLHRDFDIIMPGDGDARRTLSINFARVDEDLVLLSFRDVTQERLTANELTKTKEFLERVIDASADAIVAADMSGTILLFNHRAAAMLGYPTEEVMGKMSVAELYATGVAKRVMTMIRSPSWGGEGRLENYGVEVVAKDGTKIPILLSAALIYDRGAPLASVGVMTDLRDRIRMEEDLERAQEELRQREKMAVIAELAGAAAHELNQPLTSVLGYAEILRRRLAAGQAVTREMDAISTEAERMAEIVRKIGKITKYETKSYVGETKILDLDRSTDEPTIR